MKNIANIGCWMLLGMMLVLVFVLLALSLPGIMLIFNGQYQSSTWLTVGLLWGGVGTLLSAIVLVHRVQKRKIFSFINVRSSV